jgi:hypothetical protein
MPDHHEKTLTPHRRSRGLQASRKQGRDAVSGKPKVMMSDFAHSIIDPHIRQLFDGGTKVLSALTFKYRGFFRQAGHQKIEVDQKVDIVARSSKCDNNRSNAGGRM